MTVTDPPAPPPPAPETPVGVPDPPWTTTVDEPDPMTLYCVAPTGTANDIHPPEAMTFPMPAVSDTAPNWNVIELEPVLNTTTLDGEPTGSENV